MKQAVATLLILTVGLPSVGMAAVDKALCPEVLSRPILELGKDRDYLKTLFSAWDPTRGWEVRRELSDSFVYIGPSSVQDFKVTVVEEQEGSREERVVLQADCPLPLLWIAVEQPRVRVAFPAKADGESVVNAFKESHLTKGLYFRTDITSRESLIVFPLWRILEAFPQSNIELPSHVPADYVGVLHASLKAGDPTPVRAFRMSAEPNLDQQSLWHLILPEDLENGRTYFPVEQASSGYFNLDFQAAVASSTNIEVLTYWDSALRRTIKCSAAANYFDENHCARFNMRSYSGVLENIRNRKPFYVQLLVKLGGFMLATYRVDEDGITPIAQTHVNALAELGLPVELKW